MRWNKNPNALMVVPNYFGWKQSQRFQVLEEHHHGITAEGHHPDGVPPANLSECNDLVLILVSNDRSHYS